MDPIKFDYSASGISETKIQEIARLLQPAISQIKKEREKKYTTEYGSLFLPFDTQQLDSVKKVIEEKKKLEPTVLVVIGIGGSNLGTMAVMQALYGTLYNEQQPELKIYYADTVDTDYINDILLLVNQELEKGKTVLINLISKSGTTTESIANFQLFCAILKNHYGDEYNNYIIITTDQGSPLEAVAHLIQCSYLTIPKTVGGRYSVFSSVGLFPLGLCGVDLNFLLKGASDIINKSQELDIFLNGPALSAALLFAHYQQSIEIHNLFIFSVDLQGIGSWYRQLMAESIGKERLLTGELKRTGIVPIVSIGTTDLHSMAQLYLAGPYNCYTTFIEVEKNKTDLVIPHNKQLEQLQSTIQLKSVSTIMNAIFQGTMAAYRAAQRPFSSLQVPEKSTYYIGQLLQWKMIEIMYLGYLLQINPFDQPQVELYKQETRKILAHE